MLKHEIPVVYSILMNTIPASSNLAPSPEVVEMVCKASKDISFKKPKFERYLREYVKTGLYCHRPKRLTPEREVYYRRLRSLKLAAFIQKNQKRIELVRGLL